MFWFFIIIGAIAVELIVRFLTRNMEDKRKRERLLSLLWAALGIGVVFYWLFTR